MLGENAEVRAGDSQLPGGWWDKQAIRKRGSEERESSWGC